MAVRASSDNLSLDIPSDAAVPVAPVVDFSEVWAHRESLRQACTRLIGDPSRAEDLVQETFLSALKSGRSLERRESMGPWLATVARRRSIDELRGRRKLAVVPAPPEPEPTVLDDPAEQFLSGELVAQLRDAIAELTPRERQLLLRQATHGLSLSELAAEEETSVASVRSVLTRARQKVRMSLERGGALGGLPVPRWLLSLREKAVRWALLWEPSLPSLTGAGAQVAIAIAAAVALLLGGGGKASWPEQSLTMIGADSISTDQQPTNQRGTTSGTPVTPSARPERAPSSQPAPSEHPALAPLPPGVDMPDFPVFAATIDQTSLYSIGMAADGQTLLASGSGFSGGELDIVFRSFDGGRSWHPIDDNSFENTQRRKTFIGGQLLVTPDYPTDPRIFVKNNYVLQRSDDAGLTWTIVPVTGGKAVMSPLFSEGDPKVFLTGRTPAAYDADKQETTMLPSPSLSGAGSIVAGPDYATSRELLMGTTLKVGTADAGAVYSCVPAGCSLRATFPDIKKSPQLLVLSTVPGVVFAWFEMSIYRSTDYGHTFSPYSSLPAITAPAFSESGGRLFVSGAVEWNSPTSATHMSTDGGLTWTPVGLGTWVAKTGTAAIVGLPGNRILAAAQLGVVCSADNVTWYRRCPP